MMMILPRKALSILEHFCFCFIADMAAVFHVLKSNSHVLWLSGTRRYRERALVA